MRKTWKRLWAHRPRLSRGQKTVRNFLLCVPMLVLFWGARGYPLPTAEMEFHRMERANLLPRSEIILNTRKSQDIQWRDLPNLGFWTDQVMIGVEGDQVHVANLLYNTMDVRPLGGGITPVPLYNVFTTIFDPGKFHNGIALLFLNVPVEAARAEIKIEAGNSKGGTYRYAGEGWRIIPGRWIFCAYPGDSFNGDWYAGGAYTLRLYQADGSLLVEQSGSIPE